VCVQFEVVLPPEELLAHLALESASTAMGGQVTPQVAFTWKYLENKELPYVCLTRPPFPYHLLSSGPHFQPLGNIFLSVLGGQDRQVRSSPQNLMAFLCTCEPSQSTSTVSSCKAGLST
jgi:hypothetical protein